MYLSRSDSEASQQIFTGELLPTKQKLTKILEDGQLRHGVQEPVCNRPSIQDINIRYLHNTFFPGTKRGALLLQRSASY